MLGSGLVTDFLCTTGHEPIRESATKLFTEYGANNWTDELKTDRLGTEMELLSKELRDLDCKQNAGEIEHDSVCD